MSTHESHFKALYQADQNGYDSAETECESDFPEYWHLLDPKGILSSNRFNNLTFDPEIDIFLPKCSQWIF